ncbi:MAG: hypothetical protein II919_08905 [Lachnospiraceae bacterium]|nr:hypothetical protein [Lachnospiraceae bacterium]
MKIATRWAASTSSLLRSGDRNMIAAMKIATRWAASTSSLLRSGDRRRNTHGFV